MLVTGWMLVVVGFVGLFFFFMVPAMVLVFLGIPMVVAGSIGFDRGKERLARGPGRAG